MEGLAVSLSAREQQAPRYALVLWLLIAVVLIGVALALSG